MQTHRWAGRWVMSDCKAVWTNTSGPSVSSCWGYSSDQCWQTHRIKLYNKSVLWAGAFCLETNSPWEAVVCSNVIFHCLRRYFINSYKNDTVPKEAIEKTEIWKVGNISKGCHECIWVSSITWQDDMNNSRGTIFVTLNFTNFTFEDHLNWF